MTDIDIRAAIPSDAERLFRIKRVASLAAFADVFPPGRYPFPDDAVRSELEARLVDGVTETLVAQRYGRPVGYVSYAPELLVSLFVDPDVQGSGIGSALHDLALAAQPDLGAAACRLWVLEGNQVARNFYERRGWREHGRRRAAHFPPQPQELGYSIDVQPS